MPGGKNSQSLQACNVVEKFWSIPELVALVMEFLPPQALYRCSLVSRSMSSHALDARYALGVGILDWLRLAAPLVPLNNIQKLVCKLSFSAMPLQCLVAGRKFHSSRT